MQGQIVKNKQTINQVIENVMDLGMLLNNLTKNFQEMEDYLTIYVRLDRAITDLQDLTHIIRNYLTHIKLQLNTLSLGHLTPSIISPKQLRQILTEIQEKVRSKSKVPFDPDQQEDRWKFYQTVTCTAIVKNSKVVIVLSTLVRIR